MSRAKTLPASRDEIKARAWDAVDIVLVTGDAYVDHPSFGVALIGRWLEAHNYRVAVLAQPRHRDPKDFKIFGRPRLFFGITAGSLDSIVANYTGNGKVRDRDDFSPAGNPYFSNDQSRKNRRRPDRATIRYANLARAAFKGVPIVLGGIEASLRRFVHYDYQQQKLRTSILADAKADILVYGMGERAVLEIAERLAAGHGLDDIPGTCQCLTDRRVGEDKAGPPYLTLPGWDEISDNSAAFMAAEKLIDKQSRALGRKKIRQRQPAGWLIQHPPAAPLTSAELDKLYDLPFSYSSHPKTPEVPALRMIRNSVTIVRGCCGNCSFCAITRHQGPMVICRSQDSILAEIKHRAALPGFKGTITDLGGPTANLFGTACSKKECRRRDCLYPKLCKNLTIDEAAFLDLLEKGRRIKGIKHLFISSGLRMELLLKTPQLLAEILTRHTPGSLKIAPEHTEPEVLRLMHKQKATILPAFVEKCRHMAQKKKAELHLTPYLISSHPGCTLKHMRNMAARIKSLGLEVRQFQDFTPTPGTLATAMYVSGLDRDKNQPVYVATKAGERRAQRLILEKLRPGKTTHPKGKKKRP